MFIALDLFPHIVVDEGEDFLVDGNIGDVFAFSRTIPEFPLNFLGSSLSLSAWIGARNVVAIISLLSSGIPHLSIRDLIYL